MRPIKIISAILFVAISNSSYAATATTTMRVTATVLPYCVVTQKQIINPNKQADFAMPYEQMCPFTPTSYHIPVKLERSQNYLNITY